MTARVVGLRALKLGDFCCAVPAWKALRRGFPEARTVLAAPAWQAPLVELCPAIDELLPTGELEPLPDAAHGADVAVNLHGRGPQSSALLADTRPRRLHAFAHPDVAATAGGPAWDEAEHEVHRWCRLVEALGVDADPSDLTLEVPAVPPPVPAATVVHAGASAPARCWPVERWAAVAAALHAEGHAVVLTGTAGDVDRTARIRDLAGLPPAADRAGRTAVAELAALVAAARLVLTGDTGPGHLASAYGTPSVVLFGPTPPSRWGPPAFGPHRALWAGSTGPADGDAVHPGLLEIEVADVLAAARTLPTGGTPPTTRTVPVAGTPPTAVEVP